MAGLNIDADALKTITAKAIVDSLTEEARQELVLQAIENAIHAPKSKGYGPEEKSALQQAFDYAVAQIAKDVVKEFLEKDTETRDKIVDVIHNGIMEAFETNAAETSHSIAEAIGRVFQRQ